jgi:hypothetical protein
VARPTIVIREREARARITAIKSVNWKDGSALYRKRHSGLPATGEMGSAVFIDFGMAKVQDLTASLLKSAPKNRQEPGAIKSCPAHHNRCFVDG